MCGIATIAIGRKRRGRVPYPLLRKLVTELLVELQPRGLDATGIAIVNQGNDSIVFKKALRPARFVTRPLYKEVVETRIGPKTDYILLHARATTVGGTFENYNNHPIITERMVAIHNGTLWNDDKLFQEYNLPRKGSVDSEVIPRLYEYYVDQGESPRDAMVRTGTQLGGAFTGAVIDKKRPHQMVMFKHDRSLCLFFIPHYDIVIAVSEARFFANAARRLQLRAKGSSVFVENGTGLFYDLNSDGCITENVEDFEIPVSKNGSRYPAGHAWMTCE